MTRFFIVLAAAAMPFTAPLAAQTPAPARAAAAPARVSIPFNPPLGRPLRYRTTVTKVRGGNPITVWTVYELQFTRRPGGFRVAVRATDAGSPGMTGAEAAMVRRTVVGLNLPYVLLLNERGVIEGMEDEEGYWNRVMALTERMVRQNVRPGRPTDEAALNSVMGMMRETSREARIAMLTENIAPILEFGATEFEIGEERTSEAQVEGMMGMTMRQQLTLRAERVENGRLRMTLRGTVPQEDMRRAIENFIARIPVTGQGHNNQAERDQAMMQLRTARIEQRSDYAYVVALDSGLAHSIVGEDRSTIEMNGQRRNQGESFRIERLD